jgi:V8-like Glu-specific endopeptidase
MLILKIYFYVFLMLSSSILYAQKDWLQGWRDATVAIGVIDTGKAINRNTGEYIINSHGDTTRIPFFRVIGTGLICALPDTNIKIPLLLTAKHVFFNKEKNWDPKSIQIRFSWFSDKSVSDYLGVKYLLKNNSNKHLWFSHPDENVDLAIIPLGISIEDAGKSSLLGVHIQDFADENEAFEGASVLIFGYPGAVGHDYWTKPLLRHGTISHVDNLNFGKSPFLIDAMIFPGNSGGPVFIVPSGMGKNGSFNISDKSSFLGIVSSTFKENVDIEKTYFEFESSENDTSKSHFKTFDYMGIGVIEAAGRVKELLEFILKDL